MSTTTNLALNEPAYNSTSPTWDQPLNYNATILDQMFGNTTGVSVNTGGSTTYTNITAPSATAAGSTSQAMRFNLTGALAANQNVLLPQSVAGMWIVSNNTSGAYTVTIGSNNGSNAAAGTTVSCPQGYSILVYCDGTNVKKADDGLITSVLPVTSGGTGLGTLTANNVILGNGTSAVQFVAPGTSGNVLQSNGTTWSSVALSNSVTGTLIRAPRYLTSGTSYTTPSNCTSIYVELVGGGGGGGACSGGQAGGGGAGGYAAKYFSGVSPSTSYTYAIGAAGTAGTGYGAGGNGGATSFTALSVTITGNGGNGGSGSAGSTAGGTSGGTASNGDINIQGGPGMPGMSVTPNQGGQGGAAAIFGSMTWNTGTTASYGSGGAGAQSSGNGGAGGAGVIRIWEYT